MGGDGLDVYFGEQGLSVGIQKCLERFHRAYDDYLNRQFSRKWDSSNGEGELAMARTTSLLVDPYPFFGQCFLQCSEPGFIQCYDVIIISSGSRTYLLL